MTGLPRHARLGGVRFVDFLHHYRLGTKSGQDANWRERPWDLYKYVGFETPDEEYYVNVDMKSLKQVGRIVFSDEPLPDYWGEEGYDTFIGL